MSRTSGRRAGAPYPTPPWTRAPLLLWRQPGVVLALVVAAAILGIAGASAPLFLASTSTAGLAREIGSDCPEWPRPAVTNLADTQDLWKATAVTAANTDASVRAADPVVRAAMRRNGLPDPYRVLMSRTAVLPPGVAPRLASPVTLYARPGATDRVEVLHRVGGRGLWIPDELAGQAHLHAGQTVRVAGRPVRVVAVYRDLARANIGLPEYWCSWASLIVPSFEAIPPPLVLTDDATLLGADTLVAAEWFSPTDSAALTLPTAREVSARTRAVGADLAGGGGGTARLASQTFLDRDITRAVAGRNGLRGPVVPVAVAGTLVALLLVGAAGGYWAERRALEVRLLAARGVTPFALGVKAVLEMLVPAVAGLAVGWLAAIGLVRWLAPSPLLEPGAPGRALVTVALVGLAGVLLLGVVAAARSRGTTDRRSGQGRPVWQAVPWELALLAAATVAYLRVRGHGVTIDHFLVQIPPLLVAFPLLALTGVLLLLARLCGTGLPLLRRVTARLGVPGYLASRRATANGAVALALLVATAIPVGVLAYAATLAKSADATVTAKIRTNLGADHTVVTLAPPAQTPPTGGHGTVVSVFGSAVIAGDSNSGVLGVDPATFPGFAASGLASRPLGGLVALLHPVPAGRPLPAILVNAGDARVDSVRLGRSIVPVRVVDREQAFPGVRTGPHPTVVLRRDALRNVDFYADRKEEIWTTDAQVDALRDVVRTHHVRILYQRAPVNVLGATDLVTVTWALGYLQALAVLAGLIAVAGLLLYLAARARSRIASYVLGRRMGVSRRGHFLSLVIEIGALAGAGCVLGLLVADGAVGLVNPLLDVNPEYPPAELLTYPVGTLVGIVVALLATTAACSITAQRTADRTPPSTVMRLGG